MGTGAVLVLEILEGFLGTFSGPLDRVEETIIIPELFLGVLSENSRSEGVGIGKS